MSKFVPHSVAVVPSSGYLIAFLLDSGSTCSQDFRVVLLLFFLLINSGASSINFRLQFSALYMYRAVTEQELGRVQLWPGTEDRERRQIVATAKQLI